MAYDAQMSSDPKVLAKDWPHIRVHLEKISEILKSEDLEVANQTEENADEENDGRPIEPGGDLHDARYGVAYYDIAQEGNLGSSWGVPPYLVCSLG